MNTRSLHEDVTDRRTVDEGDRVGVGLRNLVCADQRNYSLADLARTSANNVTRCRTHRGPSNAGKVSLAYEPIDITQNARYHVNSTPGKPIIFECMGYRSIRVKILQARRAGSGPVC